MTITNDNTISDKSKLVYLVGSEKNIFLTEGLVGRELLRTNKERKIDLLLIRDLENYFVIKELCSNIKIPIIDLAREQNCDNVEDIFLYTRNYLQSNPYIRTIFHVVRGDDAISKIEKLADLYKKDFIPTKRILFDKNCPL